MGASGELFCGPCKAHHRNGGDCVDACIYTDECKKYFKAVYGEEPRPLLPFVNRGKFSFPAIRAKMPKLTAEDIVGED